jgi:hypothetical protein
MPRLLFCLWAMRCARGIAAELIATRTMALAGVKEVVVDVVEKDKDGTVCLGAATGGPPIQTDSGSGDRNGLHADQPLFGAVCQTRQMAVMRRGRSSVDPVARQGFKP